jgi:3-dehydroquinate synthase
MAMRDALILAAGRGERLDRPNTPKPLVEVGGTPLIVRLLSQLEGADVDRAVVVVGYEGGQIVRTLTNHPDLENIEVEFVEHDDWERGIASSVEAASGRLEGDFLMAMADHWFDDVLVDRMAETETDGAAVQMLVDDDLDALHDLESAVKVAREGERVVSIGFDLEDFEAVDAGLFATSDRLFEVCETSLRERETAQLTEVLQWMAEEERVEAIDVGDASWFDIDRPRDLVRAEMEYRNRLRVEAVQQPDFEAAHDEETSDHDSYEYEFTTGSPTTTDVVVQRGIVRDPSKLKLIPDESASSPIYVFTDTRVNRLYGDDFVEGLRELGYDVQRVVMAEGEESKTLDNYVEMAERVLGEGIDERSVLISLGGGAVCNVCGFLASTLYRGIGLIHVPTTLMAQCDAAIGHKQGVNGDRGKNHIGAYYPPIRIAVDVDVLQTLDDWLIPDGLSEVVKHALGQDADYLDYLLDYDGDLKNPEFLEHVVRRNIELKCELMAIDPKEHREGLVLQYGHEVGHPVEYLSGYGLNHGESVAIGMMVSSRVAKILGGWDDELVDLHRHVIDKYGLPTDVPESIEADDVIAMTRYNKKYLTEGTRMALVDDPGELWSVNGEYGIPVSDDVIREAVEQSY